MTNDTITPETTSTPTLTAATPAATAAPAPAAASEVPPIPAGPQPSAYPVQRKTNTLGIITLVLGVLGFGLVPVITGHIALGQIKRTGEEGRGLTLAGLILGYVTLAGWLLVAFFWIAAAGLALIGAAAQY